MEYQQIKDGRQPLSFSEANILKACMEDCTKEDFLFRMDYIVQNTENPILQQAADRLVKKILPLSDAAFLRLCKDVKENSVLFPPNYYLPMQ